MSIPFSQPELTTQDIDAVSAVLQSGWLTTGAVVADFEQALQVFTGAQGCVCFSSATAGLSAALFLCGVGPGDEVIVPAYTFSSTASVVVQAGARPVIVDCSPGSAHLDAQAVLKQLSPKTAAVIGVDFAGIPCDYTTIKNALLAAPYPARGSFGPALGRIPVIADAAHSLGAQGSGTVADISVFSFHATKNLTTGEGGALCWQLPEEMANGLATKLRQYALHGMDKTALQRGESPLYDVLFLGEKCNLTDFQAALGHSQLKRYPATLQKRRQLVAYYDTLLPANLTALHHPANSSCHLYCMQLPPILASQRDAIFRLLKAQGIHCNAHFKPLPQLTAYQALGYRPENYPHANARFAQTLSLPLFNQMTMGQVETVCHALGKATSA